MLRCPLESRSCSLAGTSRDPGYLAELSRDSRGQSARMTAFAGDHFRFAIKAVDRNFCVGCHAGHTVLTGSSIADLVDEASLPSSWISCP